MKNKEAYFNNLINHFYFNTYKNYYHKKVIIF